MSFILEDFYLFITLMLILGFSVGYIGGYTNGKKKGDCDAQKRDDDL